MKIKTEYDIQDILYIKIDPEQLPHRVVGIVILPGAVKYRLSYLGEEYELYNFELSREMNPMFPDADDENPPDEKEE